MQRLRQDVRRAGDERKPRGACAGAAHRKADKRGRAQQRQVGTRHAGEIEPGPLPVGLAEPDYGHNKNNAAQPAEHRKDRQPAKPLGEVGAECRRDRRGQRHRHHDQRQSARRRLALIDVVDHRTAQHDAGAGAERLQNASRDQCRQRPCGAAQRRPDEKRRQPGEQHRTSPEAVGYRTVDKLPGANPGEIEAHDELHMRRRIGK